MPSYFTQFNVAAVKYAFKPFCHTISKIIFQYFIFDVSGVVLNI